MCVFIAVVYLCSIYVTHLILNKHTENTLTILATVFMSVLLRTGLDMYFIYSSHLHPHPSFSQVQSVAKATQPPSLPSFSCIRIPPSSHPYSPLRSLCLSFSLSVYPSSNSVSLVFHPADSLLLLLLIPPPPPSRPSSLTPFSSSVCSCCLYLFLPLFFFPLHALYRIVTCI